MKNKKTIGEVLAPLYENYCESGEVPDDVLQKTARLTYLNGWEIIYDPITNYISDTLMLIIKSKTDRSNFYATYMQNKCRDKLKFYLRRAKVENL